VQIRNINKDKKFNIKGGTVFDGFPSGGLVNAIASEFLIRTVGMELVGVVDSPEFPALSIITKGKPQFPARLYVNEDLKLGIFISELDIFPAMQKDVANAILKWTVEHQCKLIISAAGIIANENANTNHTKELVTVVSNQSAEKLIHGHGFLLLKDGSVTGIPASLLNEGASRGLDVIVLIVNTTTEADFHAAALVSKAISSLVQGVHSDISSLMEEAEGVENKINKIRKTQNYLSPYE
jgi:uncharacterized protein